MLAWKQPFIQRVRNSSLVERQSIDDNRASSIPPKLWIAVYCSGRGASQWRRSQSVRIGGAIGKENVGISNDNDDEKSSHRKTKVSPAMLISRGLVGT